jgi:hypothetical protein
MVPVIGDFYNAGKNVRMSLDGTNTAAIEAQMAMEKMNAEVAEIRKAEKQSKAMEALTKSVREFAQATEDALALEKAQTDAEKERIQVGIDHRNLMKEIAEDEKKAREMPLKERTLDWNAKEGRLVFSGPDERTNALAAIGKRRADAEALNAKRLANLQKQNDASAAEEVDQLVAEFHALGLEKVRLDKEHADFVRDIDLRTHQLKIDAIDDEEARALASIKFRYEQEQEAIKNSGKTLDEQDEALAASERARQQEVANFEAQQARQRAASLQSLDEQLAEARDAADATLTDQDRRLRAIDRQEAAALAGAVVGGAVPLDMADRIRQLADLQRAAVGAAEPVVNATASAGVFSGAMLQSLQGANISAAEETAENTAALLKSSNEMVRELRKKGVFFL